LDGDAGDGANGINSVTYKPHEDLEPGVNRVQLTVRDRDGHTVTRDWSFRVR
jgi:methionine-rich copper-binding protein CopC